MTTNNAPAVAEKKTAIKANGKGLHLTSLEEMYRFADCVAQSGMAPKGLDTPQKILVAIQLGAEVGMTPMAAIQGVAVINGRPALWGDGMLATCQASPHFDHAVFQEFSEGEGEEFKAVCIVGRVGAKNPHRVEFSAKDAKKAGLLGKSGPWTQYPKRMMQMRARSFALRDTFADLLRGMSSAEEVRDIVDVDHEEAEQSAEQVQVAEDAAAEREGQMLEFGALREFAGLDKAQGLALLQEHSNDIEAACEALRQMKPAGDESEAAS